MTTPQPDAREVAHEDCAWRWQEGLKSRLILRVACENLHEARSKRASHCARTQLLPRPHYPPRKVFSCFSLRVAVYPMMVWQQPVFSSERCILSLLIWLRTKACRSCSSRQDVRKLRLFSWSNGYVIAVGLHQVGVMLRQDLLPKSDFHANQLNRSYLPCASTAPASFTVPSVWRRLSSLSRDH